MIGTTSLDRLWKRGALACATLLLTSCASAGPDTEIRTQQQPIVNGVLETGYPAVGALTIMHPAYGYVGSFCTGTLIQSQWVLTAAHCLDDDVGQITLTPGVVRFFVGADATSPSSGTLHAVDAFYINSQYTAGSSAHDIALVHLTNAVSGVTPHAINTSAMTGTWVGDSTRYVGFGVNDGINETGGGIKRRTDVPISGISQNTYNSDADAVNTGVCFGDSGGPGLRGSPGSEVVIGVNSTVGAMSGDPCLGTSTHTRVDTHVSWITGITGGALPSCQNDPNMCYCAAACQPNGTCNNTACEVLDCADINFCFNGCASGDDACYVDCYLQGTAQGRAQYDAIMQCAYDHSCDTAPDWQTCVNNNCQTEIDTCFAPSSGTATCEDMVTCSNNCPSGDQSCYWGCYESGSVAAQGIYDTMQDCFDVNCSQYTGTQWQNCVWQNCAVEIESCLVPANCDIAGGDCAPGTACYPTQGGNTDCYTSDEHGLGQTCDPNLTDRLSCDDGMLCASWMGSTCVQMCQDDLDCLVNEVCDMPVFSGITDIGWCNCVDADNDGECAPDDCDDNNAATHHGAVEACDGVDNNCDGTVDEGCASCTDNDGDTYCDDVDCNDNDDQVNPGAAERCGDNVDNNCDGQIDEGCATCDDFDGDGYCFEVDCDDNDASAYPGAAEVCDGVDNNCNGQIDEGCTACVDLDQDGACDDVDCDDQDSRVFPGNVEICDGLDNDCDGLVDENCGGGASNHGGCATGGAPGPLPLLLGLLGLLGLLVRRRRR